MAAAATPLSVAPSSFNNNYRMSRVSLHIHSDQLQKGIMSLSAHLQSKKCNSKIYMIPGGAIYCRFESRLFATAGSLDIDGTQQGNHVSHGVWGPKDSQRSMLLDASTKTLDNDLVINLEELFEEVKTMIKMGNKNEALDLLEANYEAVKEQMDTGSRGIEEAAILDIVALGYMVIEDFKMVGSLLDMLNEVVNSLKDDEPFLDLVLIHMGSMYSTLGKSEKSILVYRRGLEIIERDYGNHSTFLVTPLLGMGKVLSSIGRATKAIDIYLRVITILEDDKGESEELVVPLYTLGNLLIKEGKAADAENHFTRILNIYRKQYGECDERVAMAMRSLANVKCAKGEMDEAIELCRNAIQVLKDSSMSLDDNRLEKMRIDLAELLHAVGRGNEGRAVLEECLLINEKYRGREHPSSVTNLINLATSYSRSKNYVESERLLRTSLRIMRKSVGPDDQSLSFPMLHLAVTLYNLKKDEEAEKLALKVLRIREKAFGKESVPVGEALDCLVSIQSRLEREDSKLLKRLKRVLRIQEKSFGPNSKEAIETLKKVVFYLDRMGKKDEKLPLQRRLSVLINKYKDTVQF